MFRLAASLRPSASVTATTTGLAANLARQSTAAAAARVAPDYFAVGQLENNALSLPRFWTGTPAVDPERFEVDATKWQGKMDDTDLPLALVDKVQDTYKREGVVHLKNTGLGSDLQAMRRWATVALDGRTMKAYEGGANYRTALDMNVFDVGAPPSAHLHYHHEMAYVGQSTEALGFCCAAAIDAPVKADGSAEGATFLSENNIVTDLVLESEFGRKLAEKGICYIRCLTDKVAFGHGEEMSTDQLASSGVYNHWQQSFGTTDQAEAERRAKAKGLHVSWGPGRYMRTKFYVSGFEYDPRVDRNLLYASVADDGAWFDSWPGVRGLPPMPSFEEATPDHRPLKITFGDDTPMTDEELQFFCDIHDAGGVPINWRDGDVATFDNKLWSHGRPGYSVPQGQSRVIGVVLGQMYDRAGQIEGKF